MSKVVTTTLLPDVAGGSVTLGGTGDSVVVTGNDIRTNALQDAGGNAVFTSNGSGVLSGVNSGLGGALNLIQSQTASNSASVSFTSGLDSTYDVYVFKFIDINPATDDVKFSVQFNVVAASGFNETMTTSAFRAHHDEADSETGLAYQTGGDQAQGTAYQVITDAIGSGGDESGAGELHLFNPASTTYVKHFYSMTTILQADDSARQYFVGGYVNATGAVDEVSFKMASGNMDGIIKLYGISKS